MSSLNSTLKIAVILSAFDRMSSVIDHATSNAQKKMRDMMSKSFMEGGTMFMAGEKIAGILAPAIDSFGEFQEAQNNLKASMMGPGGMLDGNTFNKISNLSMDLSDKYAGSAASYLDMVTVLKNNRIDENDILGGIGESTAKLADLFQMLPADIAEFSAHMKNDMGILPAQMDGMMDMIARIHNAGVGKTGSEALTQMNEFFSKASLGAANLGIQGLEATKQMGALGALFMSRGLSGQSVGTNFRRIFDGLRDATKVQKMTEVAKQYGIQLELFDKKGKFLGIDNFIQQLGKMQNLAPQAVAAIFKPLGGKQGLSTDFMEYLGKNGLKGYSEFIKKIQDQANYTDKLHQVMGGLNYIIKVMKSSFKNLQAVFGATLGPPLEYFFTLMNKIIGSVRNFLQLHPRISKMASTFLVLTSAGLMLVGIIKIIQGIRAAFLLLNIVMAANPFILIGMAIIAVASIIYTYWDKIGPFFSNLWDGIKNIFSKVWDWIKFAFLNFTPLGLLIKFWSPISKFFSALWDLVKAVFGLAFRVIGYLLIRFTPVGLIYKYWDKISGFFSRIWNTVTGIFSKAYDWIKGKFDEIVSFVFGIGKQFYDAGVNIINSIINGITSKITHLTDKIRSVAASIRNFFPFSPAKEGPLKDIHKVKIIESIAASIKPNLLISKMRSVANQVASTGASHSYGRGSSANFAPVFHIHLSGSATKEDAKMIASETRKQFAKLYNEFNANKSRVGFG